MKKPFKTSGNPDLAQAGLIYIHRFFIRESLVLIRGRHENRKLDEICISSSSFFLVSNLILGQPKEIMQKQNQKLLAGADGVHTCLGGANCSETFSDQSSCHFRQF